MSEKQSLIEVPLPQGWAPVDVPEQFDDAPETVEAIYVTAANVDNFGANIVVLSSPGKPQSPQEWVLASIESLRSELPGFFLIDQQPWGSDRAQGYIICGTYIMEGISVTLMRWLMMGEKCSYSLDATCATAELKAMSEVFFDVASNCQER